MIAFVVPGLLASTPIVGQSPLSFSIIWGAVMAAINLTSITQLKAFHLPAQYVNENAQAIEVVHPLPRHNANSSQHTSPQSSEFVQSSYNPVLTSTS